ncbi:hypothetical protein GCM10009828_013710 [Actinoplanes couchii]|uniref:Uncharacterized protein n=1 Tax=Actinoplanes couchii TaxID=403638 RepID=A0ABQ3XQ19_9ACTN|nr:hypothetical protein Aco03nite_090200 [Actinoplanes couchii]
MLRGGFVGPIGHDGKELRQLLSGEHEVAVGFGPGHLREIRMQFEVRANLVTNGHWVDTYGCQRRPVSD